MKIFTAGFDKGYVNVAFGEYVVQLPFMLGHERDDFAKMLRKAAHEIDGVECVTKESAKGAVDYCLNDSNCDYDDAMEYLEDVQ